MTAADIARQTAYSAGQLAAAVKVEGADDNVILDHVRTTLHGLGAALGVIVDRVARTQQQQLDGLACVYCGGEDAAMVPAGLGRRGQMFRCFDDCTTPAAALDTSSTNPAYVPDELVNVVLRQRGLAGIFADTEKIRAELAEVLAVAIPATVALEHDRIEKLLHERIATVAYGTNWDQGAGYKQGLADAVGIMRHVGEVR